MKSGKSESAKSIRSGKSIKVSEALANAVPEIELILPAACRKYNCSYTVLVKKAYQQDGSIKKLRASEMPVRYKRVAVVAPLASVEQADPDRKGAPSETVITESESSLGDDILQTTAVYDSMQNFIELILYNIKHIPNTLMQIIRLLVPTYDNLTKITFSRCTVNNYAIYELNKILSISTITDICFDGSKFHASNISVLMDNTKACVKYISLSGCGINDETCKEIATRLHYLAHSETTLLLLNLSSNHITDEGAKHLGAALRTNRHLRYLNLADNRISDDGAISILNSLIEFVLTYDEILKKRGRHMEYLKAKSFLYLKFMSECDAKSLDEISQLNRKNTVKRKKLSATSIKNKMNNKKDMTRDKFTANVSKEMEIKAEILATESIGPFTDPFAPHSVYKKDGCTYCLGNMTLSYLNLSYNRLMYPSVKKLVNVLQYHRVTKKLNQSGLVKIVIEGNNLPISCSEYQILNELTRLPKNLLPLGGKMSDVSSRLKSRVTRMSAISQSLSSGRK